MSTYKRKTHDEWEIHTDYGFGDGFEYTVSGENYSDAKRLLSEYRENEPQYTHKIVKKRYPNK